jgi:hypothetical protein
MPSRTKEKRVDLNFTNWILGGSLLSVSSAESTKRGSKTRRVVVEVDSVCVFFQISHLSWTYDIKEGEEIIVQPSPMKHVKRRVSEAGSAKTEQSKKSEVPELPKEVPKKDEKTEKKEGKKDHNEKEKPKKCHHCPDCGEKMTKDDGKKDDKKVDEKKGSEKKNGTKEKEQEEKAGERKEDNGGQTGSDRANSKGWTAAQDAKITEMKADNKSWKEIALEVGASKTDVQHRFKELKKEGGGEKRADDGKEGTAEDPFIVGCEDLFTVEMSGGNGYGNKNESPKAPQQSKSDNGSKNGHQEKSHKHQNKVVSNWDFTATADGNWIQQPQSPPKQTQKQYTPQIQYQSPPKQNQRHYTPQTQYQPPQQNYEQGYGQNWKRLRADAVWTAADCECLEQLEQRYHVNKWLHLQADFYNWTGRMVSAELIEQKFREDGY